jgi:uncharacterized protein
MNIVLDVFSGSVHVMDELAYDIIALFEELTEEEIVTLMRLKYPAEPEAEIRECISDITELKESGKLFTDDTFEETTVDFKQKNEEVKALCLHISHTCNLNCAYCFAGQGKYQGDRALMSLEVGKQAIEFLIANSGDRTNLEVDFFGGEPLMNFEVVKQVVTYARSREIEAEKCFRFTLTTNGVLLDEEVIEFANREMNNVVLSLDGRREVHDRLRKNFAGDGSYDVIVPKFKNFVKSRGDKEYYLRGTFTHFNTDFTEDLLHMADLGFEKLSMEPVVCAPGDTYALTEEDLPIIKEQYEKLAEEMLRREKDGRGFTFYHYMIDLAHGPCIYKRVAGCGSGSEYLAVTPWGELFPCHQFVGDEKYSMGTVWDGVTNTELRDKFNNCNVYSRPKCRECWAQLYCSGGCAANAYHAAGDITETYDYGCELFRKRMECAIMLKAAETEL